MSKRTEEAQENVDPVIADLSDAVRPVVDTIKDSKTHAIFVMCIAVEDDEDEDGAPTFQSFTDVSGTFGLLLEGFYQELRTQIEEGKPAMFEALRTVIQDLEEDLGITDFELEEPDDGSNTPPANSRLH